MNRLTTKHYFLFENYLKFSVDDTTKDWYNDILEAVANFNIYF